MAAKTIHVHDSMQDYTYTLSEPMGQRFAPDFTPDLTPAQMFKLGVFGGDYFHGELDEFPSEWFTHAKIGTDHDPSRNFFGIDASQPLQEWQRKGWRQIRRHISQIRNACQPGDLGCRPRQRQALLHWAYDSRKI
jgi:hypothetical protein